MIKSKVKQGNIEDAVSDYNAIYQANQNNSKGLHALINKLCLENMVQGDNSSGSTNYQVHKMNILSLITGENIKTYNFANNNTPKQFRLLQNYPNPFNPATTINFTLPTPQNVSLDIFNSAGEKVATIVNESLQAGYHSINFNASKLSSGIYFYSIKAGDFVAVRKMILLK